MDISVSGGIELDLATNSDVQGYVNSGFSRLAGLVTPPMSRVARRVDSKIGTGAVMTLDFGTPPIGYFWRIHQINTWGADPFNNVAGLSGALFWGSTGAGVNLPNLLLPGLSFPGSHEFDDGREVDPGYGAYIVTSGVVPVGQQLGGIIYCSEWRYDDVYKVSG